MLPTRVLGGGSTIDHIILHSALTPAIKNVKVPDEPYVPAHKAVTVEMHVDEYAQVPALKKHPVIDEHILGKVSKVRTEWLFLRQELMRLLEASESLEEIFATWSRRWEEYLLHHVREAGGHTTQRDQGRGQGTGIVIRPYIDKKAFRPQQPLEVRRLARLAGTLREICRT